jgi:cell division protein FtsW (lipid II flippase)
MERLGNNGRKPTSSTRVAIEIAVVGAALIAAFLAYITNGLLSTSDAGDHETPLLIWQLIVALAGLLPAVLFAWALHRHRDRQALLWLVTGIVVYLAWGVLNDASVHGWSHLTVF